MNNYLIRINRNLFLWNALSTLLGNSFRSSRDWKFKWLVVLQSFQRDCKRNFKCSSCKSYNARFTTLLLKDLFDQVWIRHNCLKCWKLINFKCSFSRVLSISNAGKHIETITILNKHLFTRRMTICSIILNSYRFLGYRCESCVAVIAWRVTWNYTHSPFMDENLQIFY